MDTTPSSSPLPTLSGLPHEIKLQIVSLVRDQRPTKKVFGQPTGQYAHAMLSLALVNKEMWKLATDQIYKDLTYDLSNRETFPAILQRYKLSFTKVIFEAEDYNTHPAECPHLQLESLPQLSNLESIGIAGHQYRFPVWMYRPEHWKSFELVGTQIKQLTINLQSDLNLGDHKENWQILNKFIAIFPNLVEARLSVLYLNAGTLRAFTALPSLVLLHLESNFQEWTYQKVGPGTSFPRPLCTLRSLAIQTTNFNRAAWDLIADHCHTVESIYVRSLNFPDKFQPLAFPRLTKLRIIINSGSDHTFLALFTSAPRLTELIVQPTAEPANGTTTMLAKALPVLEQFKASLKFLEWGSNLNTDKDEAFLRKYCAQRGWVCTYSHKPMQAIRLW